MAFYGIGGKPNSGKATVTESFLKSRKGKFKVFSVGDELRSEIKAESDFGKKIKSYTSSGSLVPDEVIIDWVLERTKFNDCDVILDGFPRTVGQAKAMISAGMNLEKFIHLTADDETLIARAVDRMSCPKCGATYTTVSKYKRPRIPGICDNDQTKLIHRDDDNPDTISKRLQVYEKETRPVLDFLKELGIPVYEIDGTSSNSSEEFEKAMLEG